jgi:hypothetical protein
MEDMFIVRVPTIHIAVTMSDSHVARDGMELNTPFAASSTSKTKTEVLTDHRKLHELPFHVVVRKVLE